MIRKQIARGVVHNLPMDFQKVLSSEIKALAMGEHYTV